MSLVMMRWTLLFATLMLVSQNGHPAWVIASKGRSNGPTIHTTYFLTPNNAGIPVHASAYVGSFLNGLCQYRAIYQLGTETVQTGDFVDLDAFQFKALVGGNYTCATIYYTYQQLVLDTFVLIFDGVNYQNSIPATSEVTIL